MLEIRNLSVSYATGENEMVFQNMNLSMEWGNIYGIVGRNGAGKTTLYRAIAGLLGLEEGQVLLDGSSINPEDLAFLETKNYFYPYMKGREYLELINSKGEIAMWNELFGLPLEELVENYSTGMKKKLAFIGTMIQNKKLLLLDEPFNGVDLESNEKIMAILQKAQKDKIIIITSHILSTLLDTCQSIFWLEDRNIKGRFEKNNFDQLNQQFKKSLEVSKEGLVNKLT